ncbi:MAG: hypothetical protein ACLQVY_28020 [Limisphaerales bacterium]
MKRLILDHFRRWWRVLALNALLTVGLGWLIPATAGQPFAFWVLLLSMWMGAMLLGFDLRQGLPRTMLALPLTARQIGRAWWFATVAIPAAAFAGLLCFGASLWSAYHVGKAAPLVALAEASLFCFLWLGTSFTLNYGMTDEFLGNWRERVGSAWPGFLAMVMLFGSMWTTQVLFERSVPFLFFLTIGCTVTAASWIRAEKSVRGRAGFRLPDMQRLLPGGVGQPPTGYGGIRFLLRETVRRGLWYLLAAVVLMMAACSLPGLKSARTPAFEGGMLASLSSFIALFIIVFTLTPPLMQQLRLCRTMPISATTLAGVLIAIALLPIMAVGVLGFLSAGLLWGRVVAAATLKSYTFVLAPAALGVFILTQFGSGRSAYISLYLLVIAYGAGLPILSNRYFPGIPTALSTTLVAMCVLLSFLLTRGALLHSRYAYRSPGSSLFSKPL